MNICPGWYCGKILLENGSFTECGSCPRGYRRNETTSICEICTDSPSLYDWLYLGFMVMLVLVLHWFFIDMVCMRRSLNKDVLILHTTAFVEVLISCILSIFLTHPIGTFNITSCRVKTLSDWYTLLHNPSPNYEKKIYCTQEAVYPLYTIVYVFYAFSLIFMITIRPWVCKRYIPRQSKMSIYAALYFIPILAVLHTVIGGLLYYAFPILVVILSVISIATHFAIKIDQSISSLMSTTLLDTRNILILLGHWVLHAYGIISLTQLSNPLKDSLLILCVPLPSVFYILTSRFTDPSKFQI